MFSGKGNRYTQAAIAEQSQCWDLTESWSALPPTPELPKSCKTPGALPFGKGFWQGMGMVLHKSHRNNYASKDNIQGAAYVLLFLS